MEACQLQGRQGLVSLAEPCACFGSCAVAAIGGCYKPDMQLMITAPNKPLIDCWFYVRLCIVLISGIRKITLDRKRNKTDKESQGDKATCQTGFKMTKKV